MHDDYSNRFRPIRAQGHKRGNSNQIVPLFDDNQTSVLNSEVQMQEIEYNQYTDAYSPKKTEKVLSMVAQIKTINRPLAPHERPSKPSLAPI